MTDKNAPNYQIMTGDLNDGPEIKWTTFIKVELFSMFYHKYTYLIKFNF